jgi:antitoxin CptB
MTHRGGACPRSEESWARTADKRILTRYINRQQRRAESGSAQRSYCGIGMMDATRSPDVDDAARRRRLKFRCWHRGMKEVDLILGRFADAAVDDMDDGELGAFEMLLDAADPEILAWVTGEEPVPADRNSDLVRQLIAFHR